MRASEEKYRTLIRKIQVAVIVHGADTQILTSNPLSQEILGLSEDQMHGKTAIDPAWHFFREDGNAATLNDYPVNIVLASRKPLRSYVLGVHRPVQEKDVWVLVNADPVFDKEGEITQVIVTFVDITERKLAERLLTEYAAIVESTDDAIVGKTLDGIITSWNKGAERILGYRADEIVGHSILTLIPEDRQDEEQEIVEKIRRGESVRHYETVRRCKDGHLIDISVTVSPLKNSQGQIVGASKIARDITLRKRADDELRRYKDQLEETVQSRTAELLLARDSAEAANKAKSMFLANMSHELRTPLNAILGFSSLMRREPDITASQQEKLDIINRSGEHLLALINDVLEMAKIEAGHVKLEVIPFDLGIMIRDVVDMMRLRAEEKGLRLLLDQTSEFPRHIRGDKARLRQILVNLVGNAIKFTDMGGVTIRLGVKQNHRQHLLIEVEDSGPGIGQEDQWRIFTSFVQLAKGAEQKGTGLGLTITRQILELMGGSISVESTLGKGSLFRIDLPVELAAPAEVPAAIGLETGEVVGLIPGHPLYRILIAEDQQENALLLTRLMNDIGLETKVAENGEQCVRLFQDWHPDFIWMDGQMPVMDGMEAARRIRDLPGGHKAKIVAVSASAFKEQQTAMLAAGMDDLVRKPYRFGEVYDCLSRHLGLKYVYRYDTAVNTSIEPLIVPPKGDIQTLHELARLGDMREILRYTDHIAAIDQRYHPFADRLRRLVKGFQSKAILALVEEYLHEAED